MHFIRVFFHLLAVDALRLITLNSIYEKHRDVYIMNNDSSIRFQRVTTEIISNFYTVIHLRKLLFYTKGTYYGLIYDTDGVRLKLGSIGPTKIQYYTQEIDGAVASVDVKIPRWDLLVKGRNGSNGGDIIGDDIKEDDREISVMTRNTPNEPNPKRICQGQTNQQSEVKIRERALPRLRMRERPEERPVVRSIPRIKARQNDIESDSEMNPLNTLDIKLETIDSQKKTFLLKNDRNQCVTYFQGSFILSDCRKNKKQVFKLVGVDAVMETLQGGTAKGKKMQKPSEDEDTLTLDDLGLMSPAESKTSRRHKKKRSGGRRFKEKMKELKTDEDDERSPKSTSQKASVMKSEEDSKKKSYSKKYQEDKDPDDDLDEDTTQKPDPQTEAEGNKLQNSSLRNPLMSFQGRNKAPDGYKSPDSNPRNNYMQQQNPSEDPNKSNGGVNDPYRNLQNSPLSDKYTPSQTTPTNNFQGNLQMSVVPRAKPSMLFEALTKAVPVRVGYNNGANRFPNLPQQSYNSVMFYDNPLEKISTILNSN